MPTLDIGGFENPQPAERTLALLQGLAAPPPDGLSVSRHDMAVALAEIEPVVKWLARPYSLRERVWDALGWSAGILGFGAGVADSVSTGLSLFGGAGLMFGVAGLAVSADGYARRESDERQLAALITYRRLLEAIAQQLDRLTANEPR